MASVIEQTIQGDNRRTNCIYWACVESLFQTTASLVLGKNSEQNNMIQAHVGTSEVLVVKLPSTFNGSPPRSEIQGIPSNPDEIHGLVATALVSGASSPDFNSGDLIISLPTPTISAHNGPASGSITSSKMGHAVEILHKETGDDGGWLMDNTLEFTAKPRIHYVNHFWNDAQTKDVQTKGLHSGLGALTLDRISADCSRVLNQFQNIHLPCDSTYINIQDSIVVLGVSESMSESQPNISQQLAATTTTAYVTEVIQKMDKSLVTTVDAISGTESVVKPPEGEPALDPFPRFHFPRDGKNILVVIPTGNKFKVATIRSKFENLFPQRELFSLDKLLSEEVPLSQDKSSAQDKSSTQDKLYFVTLPAESDVGEQPYNDAGLCGARNRICNALKQLDSDEHKNRMNTWGIGTVLVGSIENYIQTEKADHPTDYGAVVIHNASTDKTKVRLSQGVTVPRAYVDRAKSFGFDRDPNHGNITVGNILAANVKGVEADDWHKILANTSRYKILKDTMRAMPIPYEFSEQAQASPPNSTQ